MKTYFQGLPQKYEEIDLKFCLNKPQGVCSKLACDGYAPTQILRKTYSNKKSIRKMYKHLRKIFLLFHHSLLFFTQKNESEKINKLKKKGHKAAPVERIHVHNKKSFVTGLYKTKNNPILTNILQVYLLTNFIPGLR